MARLCPVAMLFVRCRGGVSHNPLEYASPRDMGLAVAALIEFIATFDPAKI
jgi:allantoate deiminase